MDNLFVRATIDCIRCHDTLEKLKLLGTRVKAEAHLHSEAKLLPIREDLRLRLEEVREDEAAAAICSTQTTRW